MRLRERVSVVGGLAGEAGEREGLGGGVVVGRRRCGLLRDGRSLVPSLVGGVRDDDEAEHQRADGEAEEHDERPGERVPGVVAPAVRLGGLVAGHRKYPS